MLRQHQNGSSSPKPCWQTKVTADRTTWQKMTRKAFLRECRESQAASIRRYLVETTGLHRNMVNSVRSTTAAPANGKSRGYLAFLDLPASKSSWVPSREASGALSPLLATQRAPEPPWQTNDAYPVAGSGNRFHPWQNLPTSILQTSSLSVDWCTCHMPYSTR